MKRVVAHMAVLAAAIMIATPASHVQASSMITGGLTSQPIGHYEFCQVYAGECSQLPRGYDPVKLTRDRWNTILTVNSAINMIIEPRSDLDIYGR
ncbi:MAG: transglutaminase-like cysteine peptidase, partial [Pseudomonadota bacterium]